MRGMASPESGCEAANEHPRPERPPRAERVSFPLGLLLSTPGALAALTEARTAPWTLLARHASGDWGDLGEEGWQANERALTTGARLFSAYTLLTRARLWVITEADRSSTTLLTPEEY